MIEAFLSEFVTRFHDAYPIVHRAVATEFGWILVVITNPWTAWMLRGPR